MAADQRGAWQIVARREIGVKLRDRNFLMGLAFTLLVIIGSFAFQTQMSNRTSTTKIAVSTEPASSGVHANDVVSKAEQLAKSNGAKVHYVAQPQSSDAAVRSAVSSGKSSLGLIPHDDGWQLIGKKDVDSGVLKYLRQSASQEAVVANAEKAGVDVKQLSRGASVTTTTLQKASVNAGVATVTGIVFTVLFYLITMLFAMPIAQSVVEEKQSRIIEILASAVPLRQLLAGKIVGTTVLALGQLVVTAAVAIAVLSQTQWSSSIGAVAAASGWFIVFFLAGFLVVACMMAVAGSLASRAEDVQSTAQPVMSLVLVVFVVGMSLHGSAQRVASYVPVISTIAMPSRLAHGQAAWWEPIIAIIIALAAALGIVKVASTLYARSIMQPGRLSYRQAFRLRD